MDWFFYHAKVSEDQGYNYKLQLCNDTALAQKLMNPAIKSEEQAIYMLENHYLSNCSC